MNKYRMISGFDGKTRIVAAINNYDPDTYEPAADIEWVKYSDYESLEVKLNFCEHHKIRECSNLKKENDKLKTYIEQLIFAAETFQDEAVDFWAKTEEARNNLAAADKALNDIPVLLRDKK